MPATFEIDDDKRLRQQYDAGFAQGLSEARMENGIRLLRLLFKQKFGPLSPSIEQKLQTAKQPELELWVTRILFATTIDEVLIANTNPSTD